MTEIQAVFEDIYLAFLDKLKVNGICTMDDIVELAKMLQEYESDCNIVIAGQNGTGKSYLLLMLLKKYVGNSFLANVILAKAVTSDIINFLLLNDGTALGIDEMNLFFGYKEHASNEQTHLVNMIELARSKRIAIFGCIRDPRKLTYNYRTGKMSVVIWVLDRYTKGGAEAAIFVANPLIESEDRFGFNMLQSDLVSFDEMRISMENLPSFRGYMSIPDARKVLTKEEIAQYKAEKTVAMARAQLNHLNKLLHKKVISPAEYALQVKPLDSVLPKAELLAAAPAQKALSNYGEDDSDD